MTRSDAWKKRDCVQRYWAFKDEIKLQASLLKFTMPEANYHLKFYLPIPNSWSNKKKALYDGKPHQAKPDKDNLEKAFLDALCENDAYIWDGRVSKFWGQEGRIEMEVFEDVVREGI